MSFQTQVNECLAHVSMCGEIHEIPGVALGTAEAEIKRPNRKDLVLISIPDGTQVEAAFTQNRFCAAPVQIAKANLAQTQPRWLVINTGYANAGLGEAGLAVARESCDAVAELTNCAPNHVLPFSTGVIGEPLPIDRLKASLPSCVSNLSGSAAAWQAAAEGIMTTDTRPKLCSVSVPLPHREGGGKQKVFATGMAKGAGMICPNMATMLGFIAVNQPIAPALAKRWLHELLAHSFNAITVDGDTSTNDAVVLICAPAETGIELIVDEQDARAAATYAALKTVFEQLAQAIVRDGEGATKFVTLTVKGARTEADCQAIARTIAHSPLVKTALFASDPNWGRLLAAIGRAPVSDLDIHSISLWLNGERFVAQGGRVSNYDEARLSVEMAKEDLHFVIAAGASEYEATIWTTDLSHDYVKINAEYRS